MKNLKLKMKNKGIYYFSIPKGYIIFAFCILSFALVCFSLAWAMSQATSDNRVERGVYIGVFREGAPRNMNYIRKFEEEAGKKPATIMWYQDWEQNFPRDASMNAVKYGAVPHIVWEPWYWSDHSRVQLKDIIDGKWDNYLRTWAQEIRAFKHTVFLRFAHEFNIEGYPWGIVNNQKDPEIYIKAYRHVVDIFKKEKVKNVKWVWCFMNYSHPDEPWNDWTQAYPYNWGTTQDWSDWQAFKYIFRDQVRKSRRLWPDKPIMIAEFASATKGGDKAAWLREIPDYLKTSMRDIDCIIWFDLKKEADWRINSSKQSLAAFKEIMQDPIFLSSAEALAGHTLSAGKKKKKKAWALRAPGAVAIDGELSDWNKSNPVTMAESSYFKEGAGWKGKDDLSGDAYIMWDDVNFYLAAVITDDLPLVSKQKKQEIWNGDAVEIVLSVDPEADPERTGFTTGDYQIGFGTGDGKSNEPTIWNWQRRRVPTGSEIAVKKKTKPSGYVLEAKIPWEFFRIRFTPSSGVGLGFDIAFDDADRTEERERQFIWNGDFYFYKDPSVWGVLEFK
jgi:hypothetical protein